MRLDKLQALANRLRSYDKHNHRGKYARLCHEAGDEMEKLLVCVRAADALRANYHEHGGRENTDDECGLCYDAKAYDAARRGLGGKS